MARYRARHDYGYLRDVSPTRAFEEAYRNLPYGNRREWPHTGIRHGPRHASGPGWRIAPTGADLRNGGPHASRRPRRFPRWRRWAGGRLSRRAGEGD